MWSITYVILFVVLGTVPLLNSHWQIYGVVNLIQASLALFSSINVLICLWEIGLFFNRKLIKSEYTHWKKTLPKNSLPSPIFMFQEVKLAQALSLTHWSKVWSTYSLMDPSYSDQTTFGFFVDVGNGFVTLVPTILWAVGMTWPIMAARTLGIMGLIKYYQEFYGTVIYFFSYVLNERYKGKPSWQIALVISSNCVWMVFPAIGVWASYHLIWSNDYAVFH